MKIYILILVALIGFGISANAQTYIEETPTVLKSKEIVKNDPRGYLCDGGGWSRIYVIKVELVKKSNGEKWTQKRLKGYLSCESGSRINEFNENEYQYYSRELNLVGKFSEYEFDNLR
ncbi:hypothetical protein AGMMS49574_04580 [Bacteroidia bacterium]|nr:hypothetical protein AGMMS49574_04580 [Bacteroidia bacterium]